MEANLFAQNENTDSLSAFTFKWSNDFMCNTDYYYTNGFSFKLIAPWEKINPINTILFPFNSKEIELYSITLVQDIYTPVAKFHIPDQLNGDRPFAAYILLGFQKITFNMSNKIKTLSELQVGVLGPAALGEETQNGIHSLLPTSAQVEGWENQISNSFMLNYSLTIEKKVLVAHYLEFSGLANAQLGLPFTNAGLGARTKIGLFDIYPDGFGFFASQKFQFYLTLAASGNIIGYNATLQGGLFTKSFYTLDEINRFVGYAKIGLTVIYKKNKIEYIQHFNTSEFPGARSHSWGYLLIKFSL